MLPHPLCQNVIGVYHILYFLNNLYFHTVLEKIKSRLLLTDLCYDGQRMI